MISPDATLYWWLYDKDFGDVCFADALLAGVSSSWGLPTELEDGEVRVIGLRGAAVIGHYEVLDAG